MRHYIRVSQNGDYSRQDMLAAVDDVVSNKSSLRKAAAAYEVNYRTLARYVKIKQQGGTVSANSFGFKRNGLVFSTETEEQLVEYSVTASRIYHGITLM